MGTVRQHVSLDTGLAAVAQAESADVVRGSRSRHDAYLKIDRATTHFQEADAVRRSRPAEVVRRARDAELVREKAAEGDHP